MPSHCIEAPVVQMNHDTARPEDVPSRGVIGSALGMNLLFAICYSGQARILRKPPQIVLGLRNFSRQVTT